MGVMGYSEIDAEALLENEQMVADRYEQEQEYIMAVACRASLC